MPGKPDDVNLKLDQAAIDAAEARLGKLVDDEVRRQLHDKETHTMDAAQVQAALDAAKREADAAKAEAAQARKDADAAKASSDKLALAVGDLTKAIDAQRQAQATQDAARVKGKAEKVAALRARGDPAKAKDAAVITRLVGLGEAALDDQLELLTTPGIIAAPVTGPTKITRADGQDTGIVRGRDGSFTVGDWSKFPARGKGTDPMGSPIRGVA